MAWVQVIIAIVMIIVGELLRPKPKINDAKPSALGDFNFPTADASRAIPFFVGTCKFRGMNTAWYGDIKYVPIKKKVKTGLWSSKKIIQAWKYYLGVQMIVGYGKIDDDGFIGFQVDDKKVTIQSLVDHGDYWEFKIDEPTLLDNDDPPSGVGGVARLYKGTQTQPQDDYLAEQFGEPAIPAFRPLSYLVLQSFYIGNYETPPVFAPILKRCPNTLGLLGGKHDINGDANIACVAYLIMTDMLYGLKISPTSINTQSFIDCGNTLYDEGLGISMQFDTPRPGKDWLAEVLRYADAVVYPDPVTGLYTMKMARADYDVDTLEVFDDSDIDEESFVFSRLSWEETKNNIIVNYTDREADFNVKPVQYQDLANITARGGVIDSDQVDFLAISNPAAATFVSTRVGKTMASPLSRAEFKTSRRGHTLRPGSVFKLTKPNRGIKSLVVRVGDIQYGTLDDPRVSVIVTEDIFAVKAVSYTTPTPTDWTPPLSLPVPVGAQHAFELPHFLTGQEARFVGVVAAKGGGQAFGYETWFDPAGGTSFGKGNTVYEFTPSGVLDSEYPASTAAIDPVGFTVASATDMEGVESVSEAEFRAGEALAVIVSTAGVEWIAWKDFVDVGGGKYRFGSAMRGVLDAIPLTHEAGARVWIVSEGAGVVSDTPLSANGTVAVKLLPFNSKGTVALVDATAVNATVAQRAWKPYPPAGLAVNGSNTDASINGDALVTWKIRHRVAQYDATRVVAQDEPDFVATPEGSYEVKVYVGGVLKRTVQITAAPWGSYTYTPAMRVEDDADKTKTVEISVVGKNNGLTSVERKTQSFFMVDALDPLVISTTTLPPGQPGTSYNVQLQATGGATPYAWSVVAGGPLTHGMSLSAGGLLSGTPDANFTQTFTVQVQGAAGMTDTQELTLQVTAECANYTVPSATSVDTNLVDAEVALAPTGNEIHVCNTII